MNLDVDVVVRAGQSGEHAALVVRCLWVAMEKVEDQSKLLLVASDRSFGVVGDRPDLACGVSEPQQFGDLPLVAWLGADILDSAAEWHKQVVVAESFDQVPDGAKVDAQKEAEILMG